MASWKRGKDWWVFFFVALGSCLCACVYMYLVLQNSDAFIVSLAAVFFSFLTLSVRPLHTSASQIPLCLNRRGYEQAGHPTWHDVLMKASTKVARIVCLLLLLSFFVSRGEGKHTNVNTHTRTRAQAQSTAHSRTRFSTATFWGYPNNKC